MQINKFSGATFVCQCNSGTSLTIKSQVYDLDMKHYFVYDSIWMFFFQINIIIHQHKH